MPLPRRRDVDRADLLREDVLLTLHPEHPALTRRGPVRIGALEHAAWASGGRTSGGALDAVVRNVCNRLGGFEPDVRHRSDDGLIIGALVASGRAVALLPALLTSALPQITTRRLRDERLQRTIFTATRAPAADAPAVVAVREALRHSARRAAAGRRDVEVAAAGRGRGS